MICLKIPIVYPYHFHDIVIYTPLSSHPTVAAAGNTGLNLPEVHGRTAQSVPKLSSLTSSKPSKYSLAYLNERAVTQGVGHTEPAIFDPE